MNSLIYAEIFHQGRSNKILSLSCVDFQRGVTGYIFRASMHFHPADPVQKFQEKKMDNYVSMSITGR